MGRHVKETTDKREKGEKERANYCDAYRNGHLVTKLGIPTNLLSQISENFANGHLMVCRILEKLKINIIREILGKKESICWENL